MHLSLQRLAVVLLAMAVGLAGMLISQPDQGSTRGRFVPGFTLMLHRGKGECLHLHHWIVCYVLGVALLMTVVISRGSLTPAVLVLVGLLLGTAASDGVYHDLSLRRRCVVCLRPSREEDWALCEMSCQGT